MPKEINGKKLRLLISSSKIAHKVEQLGKQITQDYKNKDLLIIAILKGSIVFLADLIRHIDLQVEIDFVGVSSYKNEMKPGEIELIAEPRLEINGRDVLLVEDLEDSGGTLSFIRDYILKIEPSSLKICTLVKKRKERNTNVNSDYSGFVIDDEFIVGYGMDFVDQGRNLPDIYVIES